jgi:hypothetical protein
MPVGQGQTGTVVVIEKLNIRSRDVTRLKNEVIRQLAETYGTFPGSGASRLFRSHWLRTGVNRSYFLPQAIQH